MESETKLGLWKLWYKLRQAAGLPYVPQWTTKERVVYTVHLYAFRFIWISVGLLLAKWL